LGPDGQVDGGFCFAAAVIAADHDGTGVLHGGFSLCLINET
jgi:hypothetical protein